MTSKGNIIYPQTFVRTPGDRVPDCSEYQRITTHHANINGLIPVKKASHFRFVSLNVHYWEDCDGYSNQREVFSILSSLTPNFAALQEVTSCLNPDEKMIIDMQKESNLTSPYFSSDVSTWKELGNAVFFQGYEPLTKDSINLRWERSALIHQFSINNFAFVAVNLHLDVSDEDIRQKQINHVLRILDNTTIQNQIIMGDFNSLFDSQILKSCLAKGFVDVFDVLSWHKPHYTCWTGTVVDFILVRGDDIKARISGAYVFHNSASDHLPIITDIDLT
ncbi:Endonuclease/exonuclease/phosphatase [Globomyces pollinis-pini]|nr:Endonuclease/exonuclease/phosphatase [Globomyces pollinis-pini]